MKRMVLSILIVAMFSTLVFAEWQVNFEETYFNKGIDQAVIDALKEGAGPDSIVGVGLNIEGLNPQNLVMALYCAGVPGADIRRVTNDPDGHPELYISPAIVTAGYKKSVVECGDAVADSQAYTPVATGFSGGRSAGSGGSTFASPSTF